MFMSVVASKLFSYFTISPVYPHERHCFGQSTKLGVYRWLILSLLADLLAHWIEQWSLPPVLDWKATCDLTLSVLFPSVLWLKLLRYLQISADIAARHGFEIILKPILT
jgi:hypothetical protein